MIEDHFNAGLYRVGASRTGPEVSLNMAGTKRSSGQKRFDTWLMGGTNGIPGATKLNAKKEMRYRSKDMFWLELSCHKSDICHFCCALWGS